ncbi:MAG TPA: twin-arginine translocase TatA/TatE family subunit [Fimbriimonadaceae bacterium]|jgi:sec-independent protein translocase protein TatA|nr:twin-arginine translocase TatA/TatE family subunit [Fimbriimonadaceae bacterium]
MSFGTNEMLIVVGVIVLLFGGKKIPELMRGVGKGVGELKKGLEEGKRSLDESIRTEE